MALCKSKFAPCVRRSKVESELIICGDLTIDVNRYEIKRADEVIELTLREFELVKFLASQEGQIFTRENLLEKYGDRILWRCTYS